MRLFPKTFDLFLKAESPDKGGAYLNLLHILLYQIIVHQFKHSVYAAVVSL